MVKLKVSEDNVKLRVLSDPDVKLGVREHVMVGGGSIDGVSIEVGTVEDGYPLSITNSGTDHHAVFDFVIPTTIDTLGQHNTVILYCGSATEVI